MERGRESIRDSAGKVGTAAIGSIKPEIRLPQQQEMMLGRQVHSDEKQHSLTIVDPTRWRMCF